MVKVAIYPPNSLILADLIERKGHTPLVLQKQIRQKIKDPEIDSPPMNITEEDPIKGLKYAAIEVPSGVRGRMSIIGPLIDDAEAAIIVDGAPFVHVELNIVEFKRKLKKQLINLVQKLFFQKLIWIILTKLM